MYLGGPSIDVRSPNGQIQSFGSISVALDQALRTPGAVATNVYMEEFAGGWLANGCPLNVFFGGGWIAGQQEALRAAGKTACLPGTGGSSPVIQTIQAPAVQPGGFTVTGQRVISGGGVQVPSTPIVIQTPMGPVPDFNTDPFLDPKTAPQSPVAIQEAGFDNWGLLALGALVVGLLASRKG